ncbi:unnamed protein product [Acanthoscelides obtectus]|uniref:Nuclease HARBI1 n=1 Tax=Acanthoscelides obtectus TaxID=200917 RepID=A0A9P0LV18_ACAOB|nr:unnamed protein product [Acanthoscelides obtectus]CAK1680517.1 hypothetical protein AOBTE_LOCUS32719 [Acanthoscelides obtectus]
MNKHIFRVKGMDRRRKKRAVVVIIIAVTAASLKNRCKRKRWTKEWLLKTDQYTHLKLLTEIRDTKEEEDYANYFRMQDACFDHLLEMVKPYLTKQDTIMRNAISAEEKLAVTLRYLATGRNIQDLKLSVIMSPAAISQAIMDTCQALLYAQLKE